MSQAKANVPKLFKGIALFTPGGDLIYCIDPTKQERWHLHLCAGLQEILQLPEPPHFLVPYYTATIDRWLNPQTQQIQTFAEAYPLVMRHQALLNAVFNAGDLTWQAAAWQEGLCDPVLLATYRNTFPQLWEEHDLIVRFERWGVNTYPELTRTSLLSGGIASNGHSLLTTSSDRSFMPSPLLQQPEPLGYVFRLFVAGNSATTERILQTLHQLLEKSLHHPYTLKVIDVFQHPEQAEADQVSATPTLIKISPQPMRKLVGNLDNDEKILQMLVSSEA